LPLVTRNTVATPEAFARAGAVVDISFSPRYLP
jgi:hypothetical protein